MPAQSLRVLIIGAGLAGPCLAQGLRQAGVEVALYESDPDPAARGQGYRIHVAAHGTRALRSCLPPPLYELAIATSGRRGAGVTVLDSSLRVQHHRAVAPAANPDDGGDGISVDRLTLRQILLAGLGDTVRFAARYERFDTLPGGTVRAIFADGSTAEGDLLVGADGAGSRVRRQLLPHVAVIDTGQALIFGKTFLTKALRRLAPPAAFDGFCTIVGSEGRFMPLAAMQFRTDPAAAAASHWPGLTFHDTRDYLMWVLAAPSAMFDQPTGRLFRLSGTGLRELAAGLISDWHPSLAEVIQHSDPDTVRATTVQTSTPLEHWRSGGVTVIGDAIHCMIPAGIGAAVALRDAEVLTQRLTETALHGKPLLQAVHEYEADMLDYGFAAVAAAHNIGGAQNTERTPTP